MVEDSTAEIAVYAEQLFYLLSKIFNLLSLYLMLLDRHCEEFITEFFFFFCVVVNLKVAFKIQPSYWRAGQTALWVMECFSVDVRGGGETLQPPLVRSVSA